MPRPAWNPGPKSIIYRFVDGVLERTPKGFTSSCQLDSQNFVLHGASRSAHRLSGSSALALKAAGTISTTALTRRRRMTTQEGMHNASLRSASQHAGVNLPLCPSFAAQQHTTDICFERCRWRNEVAPMQQTPFNSHDLFT